MDSTISRIWSWGHSQAGMLKSRTRPLVMNWDRWGTKKFGGGTPWCTTLCSARRGWTLRRYNPFSSNRDCAEGILNPTEEGIGGARGGIFCHHGAPLQDGQRWDIAKIHTWIWMRSDPHRSTWGNCRMTLCKTCDHIEDFSRRVMVADPTLGFKDCTAATAAKFLSKMCWHDLAVRKY